MELVTEAREALFTSACEGHMNNVQTGKYKNLESVYKKAEEDYFNGEIASYALMKKLRHILTL